MAAVKRSYPFTFSSSHHLQAPSHTSVSSSFSRREDISSAPELSSNGLIGNPEHQGSEINSEVGEKAAADGEEMRKNRRMSACITLTPPSSNSHDGIGENGVGAVGGKKRNAKNLHLVVPAAASFLSTSAPSSPLLSLASPGVSRRSSTPGCRYEETKEGALEAPETKISARDNNEFGPSATASLSMLLNNESNPTSDEAAYRQGPIEILPRLFLGNEHNAADEEMLRRLGIEYVMNVAKEVENPYEQYPQDSKGCSWSNSSNSTSPAMPFSPFTATFKSSLSLSPTQETHLHEHSLSSSHVSLRFPVKYKKIAWTHNQQNLCADFPAAFAFVDEARKHRQCGILVHCQCGVARSASLVIAYVMHSERLSLNEAYAFVKRRSLWISPNMSLVYQLLDYEKKIHPSSISRDGRSKNLTNGTAALQRKASLGSATGYASGTSTSDRRASSPAAAEMPTRPVSYCFGDTVTSEALREGLRNGIGALTVALPAPPPSSVPPLLSLRPYTPPFTIASESISSQASFPRKKNQPTGRAALSREDGMPIASPKPTSERRHIVRDRRANSKVFSSALPSLPSDNNKSKDHIFWGKASGTTSHLATASVILGFASAMGVTPPPIVLSPASKMENPGYVSRRRQQSSTSNSSSLSSDSSSSKERSKSAIPKRPSFTRLFPKSASNLFCGLNASERVSAFVRGRSKSASSSSMLTSSSEGSLSTPVQSSPSGKMPSGSDFGNNNEKSHSERKLVPPLHQKEEFINIRNNNIFSPTRAAHAASVSSFGEILGGLGH
ncbi:uncharacterized protein VTP21DRAFT_9429 [Calcarisporiella thermophila]|uniref:uncharacterized protein n=1 Tax=Calcarisporiella thermophila TaxID=911321 RepID=UPI003743C0EE